MPLQILNKWYKVESQEVNNVIKTPSINYWEFVEGFVPDWKKNRIFKTV